MNVVAKYSLSPDGEKFPFDDPSATHTICPECVQKVLKDSGRERQS